MITAQEFRNQYLGKAIDVDGAYGAQCVDLFKQVCYLAGMKPFALGGSGYAEEIVKRYQPLGLNAYFTLVSLSNAQYGDWIVWSKGVLEEKGITVTQLSKKTGIPQSTINNMAHKEYEFKDTSIAKAIKMANALEMNVEELYNEVYFKRIGEEISKINIKSCDINVNSLKGFLEERSLSNTKFSKLCNIPRTTMSSLIHNDYEFKNTSVEKAIKMASVLEINTEDLYNAIENS